MPCVPLGAALISNTRQMIGWLRETIERDPIEQSIAERLLRAGFAIGMLWVAIGWALS